MRCALPFLTALALSLLVAAPASATLLDDLLDDYVADQRLDACAYTEKQLRQLKNLIPVDLNAYSADFVAAVDDALARRAEGSCNTSKASAQASAPAPTSSGGAAPGATAGGGSTGTPLPTAVPTPSVAQPPPTPGAQPIAAPAVTATDAIAAAARTTDPATDTPFPVLALALLAGLMALGGLLAGVVRWLAWEPDWAGRMRHAAGEASWRASSTWAEFSDFVRLGR
jgi:hypothetical protein